MKTIPVREDCNPPLAPTKAHHRAVTQRFLLFIMLLWFCKVIFDLLQWLFPFFLLFLFGRIILPLVMNS